MIAGALIFLVLCCVVAFMVANKKHAQGAAKTKPAKKAEPTKKDDRKPSPGGKSNTAWITPVILLAGIAIIFFATRKGEEKPSPEVYTGIQNISVKLWRGEPSMAFGHHPGYITRLEIRDQLGWEHAAVIVEGTRQGVIKGYFRYLGDGRLYHRATNSIAPYDLSDFDSFRLFLGKDGKLSELQKGSVWVVREKDPFVTARENARKKANRPSKTK